MPLMSTLDNNFVEAPGGSRGFAGRHPTMPAYPTGAMRVLARPPMFHILNEPSPSHAALGGGQAASLRPQDFVQPPTGHSGLQQSNTTGFSTSHPSSMALLGNVGVSSAVFNTPVSQSSIPTGQPYGFSIGGQYAGSAQTASLTTTIASVSQKVGVHSQAGSSNMGRVTAATDGSLPKRTTKPPKAYTMLELARVRFNERMREQQYENILRHTKPSSQLRAVDQQLVERADVVNSYQAHGVSVMEIGGKLYRFATEEDRLHMDPSQFFRVRPEEVPGPGERACPALPGTYLPMESDCPGLPLSDLRSWLQGDAWNGGKLTHIGLAEADWLVSAPLSAKRLEERIAKKQVVVARGSADRGDLKGIVWRCTLCRDEIKSRDTNPRCRLPGHREAMAAALGISMEDMPPSGLRYSCKFKSYGCSYENDRAWAVLQHETKTGRGDASHLKPDIALVEIGLSKYQPSSPQRRFLDQRLFVAPPAVAASQPSIDEDDDDVDMSTVDDDELRAFDWEDEDLNFNNM